MTLDGKRVKRKRYRRRDRECIDYKFVVQQHSATTDHWDLRLQMGNKMLSWSIPKGPSINPSEARLAIETQPHKLSYKDFEGVIDKGLYGAGKVLQWDAGTYKILNESSIKDAIKSGVIKFELFGEKLKGVWVLIKTKQGWILIKTKDKFANTKTDIVKKQPKSVKSGKTIDKITKKEGHITRERDLGFEV